MTLSELAMKLATEAAGIAQATYLAERLKTRVAIEHEALAVIASIFRHPDHDGADDEAEFYWKGDHHGSAALDYILFTSGDEQYTLEFARATNPYAHSGQPRAAEIFLIVSSYETKDEDGDKYRLRNIRQFSSLTEFGALLIEYPDRPVASEALSLGYSE